MLAADAETSAPGASPEAAEPRERAIAIRCRWGSLIPIRQDADERTSAAELDAFRQKVVRSLHRTQPFRRWRVECG